MMRCGHARLRHSALGIGVILASLIVCAVGVVGCSDGGSSGFDIAAQQQREQQVVADVAQGETCAELNGGRVCGAHMPVSGPVSPDLAEPVSLSPPSGGPLPCIGDAAAGCAVTIRIAGGRLPVSGDSLQAGSTLLVAVGPVDPPQGWQRGETVAYAEGDEAQADLRVTLLPEGRVPLEAGTLVRVAVLIYAPGVDVASVPPGLDLLSDFGADVAVVANDLVLQLSAAAPNRFALADVAAAPPAPTPSASCTPGFNPSPGCQHEGPPSTANLAPTTTPPTACIGDCDGDGVVRIDELITGVNIGLNGDPGGACPALHCNSLPGTFISCIIIAVNNALAGCPRPTPTPSPSGAITYRLLEASQITRLGPTPGSSVIVSLRGTFTVLPSGPVEGNSCG
jgi:hypothetical protein